MATNPLIKVPNTNSIKVVVLVVAAQVASSGLKTAGESSLQTIGDWIERFETVYDLIESKMSEE